MTTASADTHPRATDDTIARGASPAISRTVGEGGRLYLDRPLPFVVVHRSSSTRPDNATPRLASCAPAHLICDAADRVAAQSVRGLSADMARRFGRFLVLEIWARDDRAAVGAAAGRVDAAAGAAGGAASEPADLVVAPAVRVHAPRETRLEGAVSQLRNGLEGVALECGTLEFARVAAAAPAPRGLDPMPVDDEERCLRLGIELSPFYRIPSTPDAFPMLLVAFRRRWHEVLRAALFEFCRESTTLKVSHHHELGRRSLEEATWKIDRQLAAVADEFDFLVLVTPSNSDEAWREFRASHFRATPTFRYRPLPIDVELLKRRLYDVPLEAINDPELAWLLREKQEELDCRITMLHDRGTECFLHGSIQLVGSLAPGLVEVANDTLARFSSNSLADDREVTCPRVDAQAFAARARLEIERYRRSLPSLEADVEIRDDLVAGLMVSGGRLMIGRDLSVPSHRVDALVEHEVGTHLLTWAAGRVQPLKQLAGGLAGYEPLQEGLAVLAEYLAGGLTIGRLRVLAGRVVAAARVIEGASFVGTFGELVSVHGFSPIEAFTIALRVWRGGGLTKDAMYLQGLCELLDYLRGGGALETLYIGKIAISHVPIIEDLIRREVLSRAPLLPHCFATDEGRARFERIRAGLDLADLVDRGSS
jgi:uncharacterized protein (TIGR02421 family)